MCACTGFFDKKFENSISHQQCLLYDALSQQQNICFHFLQRFADFYLANASTIFNKYFTYASPERAFKNTPQIPAKRQTLHALSFLNDEESGTGYDYRAEYKFV